MSRGLMKGIAVLMTLCVLGGPFALADAPFSVQAGTDTAYIGTDSRIWLYNADRAVSLSAAVEIVLAYPADDAVCYLDANGRLIYQMLDGSSARILAIGVARPVALDGTVYYLDSDDYSKVMRVTPDEPATQLAQGEGSAEGLLVDDGKLYYAQLGGPLYQISLPDGAVSEANQSVASNIAPTLSHARVGNRDGVLRVRDADGRLHAFQPASDGAEDVIRGAALLNGTLFYVVGGSQMMLMAYDFAATVSRAVGTLPDGFGGDLTAQDGKLFSVVFDPTSGGSPGAEGDVVEIDPATALTTPVGQFAVDGEAPVLASMPGALMLYASGEGAPSLSAIFPTASTPGAQDDPDADEVEEFLDAEDGEDEGTAGDEDILDGNIEGEEIVDEDIGDEYVGDEPVVEDDPDAPAASPEPTRRPDKTAGPSGYADLSRGDHGELVRKLQARLIELGYLPSGADGDFGYNTQQAVKAFQKKLKLEQTGDASVALQRQLFAKDAPKADTDTGYTTLEKGDKGSGVKKLQTRLKTLGYYAGPANGSFTNQMQTAVKLFQEAANLKQTGKASVETQKKLFSSSAPKHSLSKLIALRPGDSGERVKRLQRRLKKLGYFTGEIGGNYQSLTTKAVKRFQRQIGEEADGVASVRLLNQIFDDSAPDYTG